MARERDVHFRETGERLYFDELQHIASRLRGLGYKAEAMQIPSAAGSFDNALLIRTNAPLAVVRRERGRLTLRSDPRGNPRRRRLKPGQATFQSLGIGATFEFESSRDSFYSGARGPWIKTSARKYRHVEGGPEHEVGTVNVATYGVAPSRNPGRRRRLQPRRTARGRTQRNPLPRGRDRGLFDAIGSKQLTTKLKKSGGYVHSLKYEDANDHKNYVHNFEDLQAIMYLVEVPAFGRGILIVSSDDQPLWEDA